MALPSQAFSDTSKSLKRSYRYDVTVLWLNLVMVLHLLKRPEKLFLCVSKNIFMIILRFLLVFLFSEHYSLTDVSENLISACHLEMGRYFP